jgi:hypothetical protein
MSKIELTISPDYVPSWTIVDAIRELFQNALDQQTENPENEATWCYNEMDQLFTISNKKSALTTKSLLLGATTKANNTKTIGQFGEGYKIATLVLLRCQKQVIFYNFGQREIWRPRFVKSRRFGTDILTFFIDKEPFWKESTNANLTVQITGITPEEYHEQIVPSNLHLQPGYSVVATMPQGEVLDSPEHKGMVFVNGLYVCKFDPYTYGYNFKPGYLKLDRDRKLASDFDLRWLASTMWACGGPATKDLIVDMVEKGVADVSYINNMSSWMGSANHRELAEQAHIHFREIHGPRAVPVTTQEEAAKVPTGYKAVIVPETQKTLVKASPSYEEPEDPLSDDASPLDKLWKWYEDVRGNLSYEEEQTFEQIYEEVKELEQMYA